MTMGETAAEAQGRPFEATRDALAMAQPATRDSARDAFDDLSVRARTFGRRYWPELTAAAIAFVALVYLLHVLTRYALPPSGDSGQWLTISRYYLHEAMPADRTATTMPPVVPVLLAVFSIILPGKPLAIVALAALCFAGIAGLSYLLGRRLTGAASGGMFAVMLVAVAQPQLYETISVGAYPQLIALSGMGLCLYALFGIARDAQSRGDWMLLQGGVALVLFSHTPSATTLLPPLAACLAYLWFSSDDRRAFFRSVFGSLRPIVLLWAVFILVNRDVVFGYVNVPATFDLKGPAMLWSTIWRDDPQRLVFGVGAFMTLALPFGLRDRHMWKSRPAMVLLIWTATLAAIVAAASVRHVNTDYPRFIPYFIVPLGLAAAAGIQILKPSTMVSLVALAGIALFAGQPALDHLDQSARFYGINGQSDSLIAASDWLNESGGEGAVIGGTRDTKWLQALTGRTSLLYLRPVSITRPWEADRAIAAEIVHRSSGGFETGRILTTVNDGGEDFGAVYRQGLRIDAYYKGMYTPVLALDDRSTRVHLSAFGKTQSFPLAGMLRSPTIASRSDDGAIYLDTQFDSEDAPVQVHRQVSNEFDVHATTLDLFVGRPAGVDLTQVTLATVNGTITVTPGISSSTVDVELFDGSILPLDVQTAWVPDDTRPVDADPSLTWQRVRIVISVPEGDRRIDEARLYEPADILHQYGVRYIVDRNGDGAPFPIIKGYGLTEVYSNDDYRVFEAPAR